MSLMVNMPVGVDDYKKLIEENYYFVDKTRFIMSLIDGHSDVTLITRPRRFGKTLTMSMLYYFFSNEDKASNRALFKDSYIGNADDKRYMQEQGKYPVIFLSLKDIEAGNFDDMTQQFSIVLSELYGRFRFLRDNLAEDEIAFFDKALNKSLSNVELQFSLKTLSKYLSNYYQEKVVILIDEYDAPIQHAYDAQETYYKEAIRFFKSLLGTTLKTNEYMKFSVMTGVLRIAKESIFSDLNNLDVCSVMEKKYSDVMGFTDEEVKKLLSDVGASDKYDEIKEWYDGYIFGNTAIYNPWSVIRYVSNGCETKPYWINTSANSIIKNMMQNLSSRRQDDLQTLLMGKEVSSLIHDGVIYEDIEKSDDEFFSMLLTTGYLTQDNYESGYREFYNLKIPNKEVGSVYRNEILDRMRNQREVRTEANLVRYMIEGDVLKFEEALSDFVLNYVSFFDAGTEGFYHGMMLGLLAVLNADYVTESNKESGYGRFDLALFPNNCNNSGVVLEFKNAEDESELENMAKEALAQIDTKAYITEFKKRTVKEIKKYGIAFCGKKVRVIGE
ncbi:ATPase AAA family [Butyrivibrio hungatei]|uniref:ATPase AAA family n=2 Tax=Butyrivibrio hungatei TaxID=185008 RepID=A0A1D9NYX2_9FIRM|nr:ATPase AAA family [Butyrivibrio hungatei]